MPWYISLQKRQLALFKDGQQVQCITFARGRNGPECPFMPWQPTHHVQTQALPFRYHDTVTEMMDQITSRGLTYDWSPAENHYSYYAEEQK